MQWRCKMCGSWVSMTYSKHIHVAPPAVSLAEMIKAREVDIDATDTVYHFEHWTPDHETRKAPPDA